MSEARASSKPSLKIKFKHLTALITHPSLMKEAFLDYHMVRRKYIMRKACQHFNTNKHEPAPLLGLDLLDIGCADSSFAAELCFRGADVVAVDKNQQALNKVEDEANKRGAIVEYACMDASQLVTQGKTFDLILCLDVLETLEEKDADKLIWSMHKMLKENGMIVFSTISNNRLAKFYFKRLLEQILHWFPKGYFRTKRFKSPYKLKSMLAKHDLKITSLQGVFFDPDSKFWHRQKDLSLRYMGIIEHKK